MSDEERHNFTVVPAEGEMDGIDLALSDPARADERRLLIQAEHPELEPTCRPNGIRTERNAERLHANTASDRG
jgi:hypothetical protein